MENEHAKKKRYTELGYSDMQVVICELSGEDFVDPVQWGGASDKGWDDAKKEGRVALKRYLKDCNDRADYLPELSSHDIDRVVNFAFADFSSSSESEAAFSALSEG